MDEPKKTRVAVLFNKPGTVEGLEDVVSAHIQLPVFTAKLLNKAGLDCLTITTELPQGLVMPNVMRELDVEKVRYVIDPNRQSGKPAMLHGQIGGVRKIGLIRHVLQTAGLLIKHRIRVLHVFGTEKFIALALVYKILLPWIRLVWTTSNLPSGSPKVPARLVRTLVYARLTSSDFIADAYRVFWSADVTRPGPMRKLVIPEDRSKHRVLFWRDPSTENGADIAFAAFKILASEFPKVRFTFAVRKHFNALVTKEDFEKQDNLDFFEVPYPEGVTLEGLLAESICVVFPFRQLSTNPQLAVVETLCAGVPLICSSIESNSEYLDLVGLNFHLSDDTQAYVERLREFLNRFDKDGELYPTIKTDIEEALSWQHYLSGVKGAYS